MLQSPQTDHHFFTFALSPYSFLPTSIKGQGFPNHTRCFLTSLLLQHHHHGFLQRRRDRPLLRLPWRRRRPGLLLHGSGVRDGEERRWGGVDGGDASGAGDEVDRPRGHGGSARYLRAHHRGHHQHRDQPQGQALLPLRRLRPPLLRPRLRPRRAFCRHGHRDRRRRRGQG